MSESEVAPGQPPSEEEAYDALHKACREKSATVEERNAFIATHAYGKFVDLEPEDVPDGQALAWLRQVRESARTMSQFFSGHFAKISARQSSAGRDPFADDGRDAFAAVKAYQRTHKPLMRQCRFCKRWHSEASHYCWNCGTKVKGPPKKARAQLSEKFRLHGKDTPGGG